MKELVSFHDDAEKRLGIFFGLGAFLLSALFSLFQGMPPESFLLRGVIVLTVFSLAGWGFGVWLKHTLDSTRPEEEMPSNMERRSRNAENLDEGSVVMPSMGETVVMEEPDMAPTGQVVNFTLPELSPMDAPLQEPAAAKRSAVAAPAPVAVTEEEGDLPPPGVPSWLK